MDKTDLMAALGDIEYDLIGEIMHAENYEEAETYAWKFEGIRAAQEIVARAMRDGEEVRDEAEAYTNPAEAAHDGCFGCKHEIKDANEWPCSDCEGAHTIADRWEPKSEKGEEN